MRALRAEALLKVAAKDWRIIICNSLQCEMDISRSRKAGAIKVRRIADAEACRQGWAL